MRRLLATIIVATSLLFVPAGCGDEPLSGDGDVGVSSDVGGTEDAGIADAGDADETGGEEVDVGPSGPEPWDCDPDIPLDDERYVALEELDGEELRQGLRDKVDGHSARGYHAAREFMFEILEVRDDGKLECVYTADRVAPDGTNTPGDQFNTEHTWPQSRGAGSEPARSDVHHLFPVDQYANNQRANHEFGHVDCDESTCAWHRGGSFLGPSADDDRDPVFQVRPERRGDVARVILYFSVRYDKAISPEEEAVLRDWHCEDPPDDYERTRNNNIEIFQNNRNPFIDRPDFVERIGEF